MAKDQDICSVSGCGQPAKVRGWCKRHYLRTWRNGGRTVSKPRTQDTVAHEARKFMDAAIAGDTDQCIEWPYGTFYNGYGIAPVRFGTTRAHRIVCILAHGEPPSAKHQAAHNCNNRKCVNPRHLRWATVSENLSDRVAHGTAPRGSRHAQAILTEADIHAIRSLRKTMTLKQLAIKYGTSITNVHSILSGKIWGWLES